MIPSLVFIKSDKKTLFTFTWKRNLEIGAGENSDILINHPFFAERSIELGPDCPGRNCSKIKSTTLSHLISKYSFKTPGLTVHLVRFRFLLISLLLGSTLLFAFYIPPSAHTGSAAFQDWDPIALPAGHVYGSCRQDNKHSKGARFTFEAEEGVAHRLSFFLGGNGDGASVEFTLNGSPVSDPLFLPRGWGHRISIPLPAEHIRRGKNIIVARPVNTEREKFHWGISEVSATPVNQSPIIDGDIDEHGVELVLNRLKRTKISGEELSRYYKSVSQWHASGFSPDAPLGKKDLMEKIEHRMEIALYGAVFDMRSKEIQGDQAAAQRILEETGRWVPRSWERGWKIYDELCH